MLGASPSCTMLVRSARVRTANGSASIALQSVFDRPPVLFSLRTSSDRNSTADGV